MRNAAESKVPVREVIPSVRARAMEITVFCLLWTRRPGLCSHSLTHECSHESSVFSGLRSGCQDIPLLWHSDLIQIPQGKWNLIPSAREKITSRLGSGAKTELLKLLAVFQSLPKKFPWIPRDRRNLRTIQQCAIVAIFLFSAGFFFLFQCTGFVLLIARY